MSDLSISSVADSVVCRIDIVGRKACVVVYALMPSTMLRVSEQNFIFDILLLSIYVPIQRCKHSSFALLIGDVLSLF